jgi:hypothetical protein
MPRTVLLFLTASLALIADANGDLLDAARKGDLAGVKAQLEKGADLETKTPYGQTPLYVAAISGQEEVVRFLLDKGANTEVRDMFYKAPILGFVLQRKHYGVARLIIEKGQGTPDGNLEAVAGTGNVALVQAVLAKGKPGQASLNRTYEMALDRQQTAVAELLKGAGAEPPAPPVPVDAKLLESYAGTFKNDQFPFDIKVSVKEGRLYMQASGQPEFAPKAKSATVFEFAPARLEVEFDSADSFTLKQSAMTIKFKKVVPK